MLIAQLSDVHIISGKYDPDSAKASCDRLRVALQKLKSAPTRPNLLLVTGDVTEHGDLTEYEIFFDIIGDDMETYIVNGNHDNVAKMKEASRKKSNISVNESPISVKTINGIHFIFLNSCIEGKPSGHLSSTTLELLEHALDARRDQDFVIALHHPVVPSQDAYLDSMGLDNAPLLENIIRQTAFGKCTVLSGHFHLFSHTTFAGGPAITCPSVAPPIISTADIGIELSDFSQPKALIHRMIPGKPLISCIV